MKFYLFVFAIFVFVIPVFAAENTTCYYNETGYWFTTDDYGTEATSSCYCYNDLHPEGYDAGLYPSGTCTASEGTQVWFYADPVGSCPGSCTCPEGFSLEYDFEYFCQYVLTVNSGNCPNYTPTPTPTPSYNGSCTQACGYTFQGSGSILSNLLYLGGGCDLAGLSFYVDSLIAPCPDGYEVTNLTNTTAAFSANATPTPVIAPTYTLHPTSVLPGLVDPGIGPSGNYSPVIPTGTIEMNDTIIAPNKTNLTPVNYTLPVINTNLTAQAWLNMTCNAPISGQLVCSGATAVYSFEYTVNNLIYTTIALFLTPFTIFNEIFGYSLGLQNSMLSGFLSGISVFIEIMFEMIAAFPNKIINTATYIMTLNVLETMIGMVRSGELGGR